MSDYKLEYKLKQHTPLIHFQHEQQGATLRATEVKPKLDKFLSEKLGGEELLKNEHPEWFIDIEKNALDYKIRINSEGIKTILIEKGKDYKVPNYFANMGDDYEPKALSIATKNIWLNITIFHSELRARLKDFINEFFLLHNFGTRQSKGFGSFTLEETKDKESFFDLYFQIPLNCDNYLVRNRNSLYKDEWKEHLLLFFYIETFYKSLRSGINRKGSGGITKFYIKPAIFYYSWYRLQKQWDKKSIKERYLVGDLKRQKEKHNSPDILTVSDTDNPHILIKDMFGLSSRDKWNSYRGVFVTKSNDSIDRFKSPILFKPIRVGKEVFIGIKSFEIDDDFFNKIFDIEFGNSNGLTLKTPSNFSWADFWSYYLNQLPSLDERCNSDNDFRNEAEYCILQKINKNINL